MPSIPWLDENRGRAYPFLKGSLGPPIDTPTQIRVMPTEWIVDAGFTLGTNVQFDPDNDYIFLYRVTRTANKLTFEFRASDGCTALNGCSLIFERDLTSEYMYETEYVEGYSGGSAPLTSTVQHCTPSKWLGFLVTGDLSRVDDLLASGHFLSVMYSDDAVIEPALITQDSFLAAVTIANDNRTVSTRPDGCDEILWPDAPDGILFETGRLYDNFSLYRNPTEADWLPPGAITCYCIETCVQGKIAWKEGYNCRIAQNDQDNSITISAVVGGGLGEPCDEVPLYKNEMPPTLSMTGASGPSRLHWLPGVTLTGPSGPITDSADTLPYSGSFTCNDVLRSINGVGGPQLTLRAGNGVSLTTDPDNNKITFDVDMLGMSVCAGSSGASGA